MSGRWDSKGNEWTNLRFPNGFAHPFMSQSRDGSAHERMLVVIPKGVILSDGRNLGGWNLSVPASPWALMQKRTGRPVNIGLRSDQPVELFKGRGAKRQVISLAIPEELRAALNEHRDRMLGKNTVRDKPAAIAYNVIPEFGQGAGGGLADAAPQSYEPANDEGMRLFNDLAFDVGFVSRMDMLVSGFADDCIHNRYDPEAALDRTRSLTEQATRLLEPLSGVVFSDMAIDCAANLALSAVTDAINGYINELTDRGEGNPSIIAANHAEYVEDAQTCLNTERCLRMFTTAYGKTAETDVFGDTMSIENLSIGPNMMTRLR